MPVCYITLSENIPELNSHQTYRVRKIVAKGLTSGSRKLDENHIAVRIQHGKRECMLGDIEVDIFAQLYLSRLFSRDKRAYYISKNISEHMHCCCATWINLEFVGYSRVAESGDVFYSDSDNPFIHAIQKLRGIATKQKG